MLRMIFANIHRMFRSVQSTGYKASVTYLRLTFRAWHTERLSLTLEFLHANLAAMSSLPIPTPPPAVTIPRLWTYVPKQDGWLVESAATFLERIEERYDSGVGRYKPGDVIDSSKLDQVAPEDRLYIIAHGASKSPDGTDVDENLYGTKAAWKMNPVELAQELIKGGLNPLHRVIKLWVCYSGKGLDKGKGSAYKLWSAMHSTHPYLTVYGYVGGIRSPMDRKDQLHASDENEENWGPPKQFRVIAGPAVVTEQPRAPVSAKPPPTGPSDLIGSRNGIGPNGVHPQMPPAYPLTNPLEERSEPSALNFAPQNPPSRWGMQIPAFDPKAWVLKQTGA
jgi:hypothetical protein